MKYAIIHGIILDGTENMEPVENHVIFVEDKKIRAITPFADADLNGWQIVDLKGKYILPGLINLHVHLAGSGKPKNKSADAKKLVKLILSTPVTELVGKGIVASCAKTQLMSGTTTIRTVGGIADYDSRLRDKINAGEAEGPRILAANMAISVPGGHMAGSLAYEANSPEEAANYVELLSSQKVDIIKLMITGGVSDAEKVGEPGILRMNPEIVKAACDKAHELGLKVAAHVESTEGVLVALRGGVDSIEHGATPNEEIIKLFKEKNSFHVLTISPALPFALFDRKLINATPEMQENGKIVFDGVIDLAKACLDAGIPVGLGTDTACPYVTQYDMWRELNYYVKYCGVSKKFALYTGTLLNARLAGIESLTGSIEVGKSADMICVSKNPIEDLTALRNVTTVFFDGKMIAPKLKKLSVVEEKLDEQL